MKNWWKTFFNPVTSEVLFKHREGEQTKAEAEQVLAQIKNKQKMKILDLCCGEGRHSLIFAKKGHEVTGLDYTAGFLKVAKERAKKSRLKIKFVKADMKETSQYFEKSNFDAVVSLYNSFGFFDLRKDDLKVLREVHKVLKSKGYFVINTLNGNGVKFRIKKPTSVGHELSKNLFMIDKTSYSSEKKRVNAEWTLLDHRKKPAIMFRGAFHQNVFTHRELKNMLRQSGFKILTTWGPLRGGLFNEKETWHQTILAQKN